MVEILHHGVRSFGIKALRVSSVGLMAIHDERANQPPAVLFEAALDALFVYGHAERIPPQLPWIRQQLHAAADNLLNFDLHTLGRGRQRVDGRWLIGLADDDGLGVIPRCVPTHDGAPCARTLWFPVVLDLPLAHPKRPRHADCENN